MKKNLFNCLHFYDFPPGRWKSIRTNHILERAFREVRQRTRPINNCFTNDASSDRILYGITKMLNKNWRGKTLKNFHNVQFNGRHVFAAGIQADHALPIQAY